MRFVLFFLLLLFPLVGMANVFSVDPSDKSMQYLGLVFGSVPGLPIQATGNPLFSQLMYIFNQVVFGLGIIIVIYTTVIGTINTAQEGEFLGTKKWHPILVPLRAAVGTYLLLPTASGYNWIQLAVMWFIIQGVGAANAIWSQVIVTMQSTGSIHQSSSAATLVNAGTSVNALLSATVCMEAINTNPTTLGLMQEPITFFQYQDQIQFTRLSRAGNEAPICGAINIPNVGGNIMNNNPNGANRILNNQAIFANAIMSATTVLQSAALSLIARTPIPENTLIQAATILQNAALQTSSVQTLDDVNKQSVIDGWIMAGSYYFHLVQGGTVTSAPVTIGSTGVNETAINQILGQNLGGQIIGLVNAAVVNLPQNGQANTVNTTSPTPPAPALNAPEVNNYFSSVMAYFFGPIFQAVVEKETLLSTESQNDPIVSMAAFGAVLTNLTEMTFWAALGFCFTVWMVTSVCSCLLPLTAVMNFLMSIFIPVATIMLALLWTEGIMMGFYIPLVPYLVFTFSAINWIILVIESMLGSPLIALSLIIPSEEEIGRAGHAIVILLGLILRPALMIVGFVLAIQLLSVAIHMLNFGFWTTLAASVGASNPLAPSTGGYVLNASHSVVTGVGVFGLIAVIFIYAAVAMILVHESFSLIYVVPNKVLRWLGASPEEGMDVASKIKEAKGAVQKGAALGKSGMTATLSKFSEK